MYEKETQRGIFRLSFSIMHIRISSLIIFFYCVLAVFFFFFLGDAMLNEETRIQFFADSTTYEKAAYDLQELTALQLIISNPNYFGMISILNLLNNNRWGILILNLFVFVLSVNIIFKAVGLDRKFFIIFLLMDPMTFSSLLSINKEVFSLLTIALLLYATNHNSLLASVACIVISFFVRWQLSLFVIVFWGLMSPFNILRHRRALTVLISLLLLSIIFYEIGNVAFPNVTDVASEGVAQWEGSGLWGWLLDIQYSGGYFVVFPLKALHSMFGILAYIKRIIDPPEFYNYVVVMLHSLTTLLALIYAFLKRKLRLASNAFYIALIYLLIFALTPIYAPRYFYPVFVLLCVLVAEKSIWQNGTRRLDKVTNKAN